MTEAEATKKLEELKEIFKPVKESWYSFEKYPNGGKSEVLNKVMYQTLEKLIPAAKSDEWDPVKFIKSVEGYISGIYDNPYFFKVSFQLFEWYDQLFTVEELKKGPFLVDYYINDIYGDDSFYKRYLYDDAMSEFITELVENRELTAHPSFANHRTPINEMVQEGYSPSDIGIRISKDVNSMINSLHEINIQVGNDEKTYFSVSKEKKEGETTPFWFIQEDDLYKKEKQIGLNSNIIKDDDKYIKEFNSKNISWPMGPYGDNEEELQKLRTTDELVGIDIRTYSFQYYKELPISWATKYRKYVSGESLTPSDRVKKTVESIYKEFFIDVITSFNNGHEGTVNSFYLKKFDRGFIENIYKIISTDKEIARRLQTFKELEEVLDQREEGDESPLTEEERKKAEGAGLDGFLSSDGERPDDGLSDEQLTDRQRLFKQCALIMNLHKLSPKYQQQVIDRQNTENFDGPDKTRPYGGRFWRANSNDKEALITNMVSAAESQYFFEMPPHITTLLTPKVNLYKVFNQTDGKLKRTEFVFPMKTDLMRKESFSTQQSSGEVVTEGRVPSFFEAQFDRGDGMGLKNLSLDFNGTTPATARNDIKGTMVLYFQSFADFIRERVSYNGDTYKFVDLIIQPKPDKDGYSQGSQIVSLRQYEPEFYRIMLSIGYNIPSKKDLASLPEKERTALIDAIKNTNKTFYLTMVDHDFNIKQDGTVEVKITYRAYFETALKSLKFDALSTPELREIRKENEKKLHEMASKKQCTKEELKEMQLAISSVEGVIVKNSLNSIMTRMFLRNKVYNTTLDSSHRRYFLKKGFFKDCDLLGDAVVEGSSDEGDLGVVLSTALPESGDEYDFSKNETEDNIIQFFFFGDLLHTILDSLYVNDTEQYVGLQNTKIVLGSFDFEAFNGTNNNGNGYNIADIPISVEFFSRWFVDNIINQKSTRKTFPILNFIRKLSNSIISNSLLETCVNRDIESNLQFQTGQISVYSNKINEDTKEAIDPFDSLINNKSISSSILQTDEKRATGALPFDGDIAGNSKIENYFHYIVLNANGSSLTYTGAGRYEDDIKNGRYHIEIGSNRGIVKSVNFSKTDMQYIREARFFRRGVDGLLQLSSVYNASVEMFGNTIFYPGMEVWINPYGFGGTQLGSPTMGAINGQRSLANILGLGGYHTITNVNLTLDPSGFKTSIQARHYYSGDGEAPDGKKPKTYTKEAERSLIEEGAFEGEGERDTKYCDATIGKLTSFDIVKFYQEMNGDTEE